MKVSKISPLLIALALVIVCAPAYAAVQIVSLTPSLQAPQVIGSAITWVAMATNTSPGAVTFQFSVAEPRSKTFAMTRDFNIGSNASGTWTSRGFTWVPTSIEGTYQIQVIAKDFRSHESAAQVVQFMITPLVTGNQPQVAVTANPLVALFSAPACGAGNMMRVSFQPHSHSTPATYTNWVNCHPPATMNFEIAGMYPTADYEMFAQTQKGTQVTNGPTVNFKTGALPSSIPFPKYKPLEKLSPQTDTADPILLHSITRLGGGEHYPDVATDLHGRVLWYYSTISGTHANLITRPLPGGNFLSIENGPNWNANQVAAQVLRQLDFTGNIVRETNTGILQQELLGMGDKNAGPCTTVPQPPPVGAACMGSFHHDAIQTLPNGDTAVLADIEKIFQPGMQGDMSGLPVDIMGDMIIVLDNDWKVKWYFDTFEHDGGPPELDINRPAVLNETCVPNQGGCPPIFLLSASTAPVVYDWLHANSLYYWPAPQNGNTAGGDIIWSSRHQDWIMRVDYRDAKGTGNILWRMGPGGDFATPASTDPWPWFSHQHDVGIEDNGLGKMTIFDNGNTRISPPGESTGGTPGLGPGCIPNDCNSRGMALTFDESAKTVMLALSQDLSYYATAMGSAQLLSDGTYFFVPTIVPLTPNDIVAFDMEILPVTGMLTGSMVLNLRGTEVYRAWQMPSLYDPPTT